MFAFFLLPSKRVLIHQPQDFGTTETGANPGREGAWEVSLELPPLQAEPALVLQPHLTEQVLQP